MTQTGSSSEVMIEGVHLRVTFGHLTAVNDLSLTLRGGELLGLIGPNGAGKTTLLRALAGLQPLADGVVRVLGNRLGGGGDDDVAARRWVGFTPDTPPVYELLTVRQFLQFIARGYELSGSEVDERIDFWLEKVWLLEKAEQKIKGLSRGMRQRLGIARTLLPNPHVILLDEPAAGLDPVGRIQFRQLLCDLREQGKAIIISSHILADMGQYSTHIGIMAHGTMLRYGTVGEVIAASGERCRYTMMLARPFAGVADVLRGMDGAEDVAVDGDTVSFQFSSDRAKAAELLAGLVGRGVPVASFVPTMSGLEEAYVAAGIGQVD
ncbi:MAG TPA: ABC transporter ATP-binding protein [Tepidisphaeraceae bacterium]|nr:ABC transporter ATP-binding protein [Tepidisphaeraceae bacterium]